jgi:endo-1,4-beta-xylanase
VRSILLLYLFLVVSICGAGEEFPAGGRDLVPAGASPDFTGGVAGALRIVKKEGDPAVELAEILVNTATPDSPWSVQLGMPLSAGAIEAGDRILISFMGRSVGEGRGRVSSKIQFRNAPYEMIGHAEPVELGNEWERIHQRVTAAADLPADAGDIKLFLGAQTQNLQIYDIRVVNYGSDFDLTKLPLRRVTYVGREPDAPWRKTAQERIEKFRKADMAVRLVGPDGKPRSNVRVRVELARHEFGFGTAVTRKMLCKPGADGDRYRDIVQRTCSKVVFENDFKTGVFPEDEAGLAELDQSIAWLHERGIQIRGHYLIQDAVDFWSSPRLSDPEKLVEATLQSVRSRIAYGQGKIVEWDVINHPIAWQGADLLSRMPSPIDSLCMDVLRETQRLTSLPLYINEDQIFKECPQQEETFQMLKRLKEEGIPVAGLGNQGHFDSSFLPSPDEILRITDRFATVVPNQLISEFDIETHGDESLAADYLRDLMTACFSHPAYNAFVLWGFWEGSHWKPLTAPWRLDWTERPAAGVWQDCIEKHWHTRLVVTSDAKGVVRWRGFKGNYQFQLEDRNAGLPIRPGGPDSPLEIVIEND